MSNLLEFKKRHKIDEYEIELEQLYNFDKLSNTEKAKLLKGRCIEEVLDSYLRALSEMRKKINAN
ncbi:hypothetical protein [Kangiella sp.]|uniref:hypothetical protein n=1 Tax=Kangiella sp. TaxID=1920245 RepID=UPI003A90F76E